MTPRPTVETERRQQILEAAMTCFARKGYHQTTMDEIAAELPFSKGLLYYYFETKRALFLGILQSWIDMSEKAWETMLSSDESATSLLRKGLEYSVELVVANVDLARMEFEFYGELGRDNDIRDIFRVFFSECRGQFEAILKAGVASGEFREHNSGALAAVLLGTYEGLAMQVIVDPDGLDWSAIATTVFDTVMQGVAAIPKE